MDGRYEKLLLGNASRLDAVTDGDGAITKCALLITEKQEAAATVELYKRISEISGYANQSEQVKQIALAVKDSLFKYYGYLRVREICKMNQNSSSGTEEDERTLPELLDELNSLAGLRTVKEKVNDLIAYQKVMRMREQSHLFSAKSTLHLAFTGNPGTGKTTVARIVGRIYRQIGLLSKGHFIEVSRTDLIAGYQGQTALKVKDVIERAKGGVLFIDEAYSITENDHADSYGRECLTELTKALEDYRDDLVVIVAGYTEPMKDFFDSNPGLKSRFNTFIEFDDYNETELNDILNMMCRKNDYTLSAGAAEKLKGKLSDKVANKDIQFANGRLVRNIYDDLVMNHARRVVAIDHPTCRELMEITEEDVKGLGEDRDRIIAG